MIYLDNAATTRMSDKVLAAMQPWFQDFYGNAGSIHALGRLSSFAISTAREQTARFFGCRPDQVVFTSGGSEGNALVFKGLASRLRKTGRTHLVVSDVEHDSVLRSVGALQEAGFSVSYVRPNAKGEVEPDRVAEALTENTGLVSVQYVNNETGAVHSIHNIGDLAHRCGAYFHTDAVQAAGLFPLAIPAHEADFATISAHKIHGPKGVGALYLKDRVLDPLICGGKNQEFGVRGGTENVPGIVGLGAACEQADSVSDYGQGHLHKLRTSFLDMLRQAAWDFKIDPERFHVNASNGKILNLRVDGTDAQTLLLLLSENGVCASAGSACQSHESQPSHVLLAMGLTPQQAASSLRFSFCLQNTMQEVSDAAFIMANCIARLDRTALQP